MLPVDGDKLKMWLEEVALPKVSDADPAALSEYIVLLLDSIDLTFLDAATKQQCVSKLHEFFETHTEPFVDELFIYINKHRQPAAAPPPPSGSSRRHSSSSASASHRDSRRRRSREDSRSRSRSPSPSASTSRSRSRSRSVDRDRDRRRRRSRDEQHDEEYKRHDRDDRDDRGRGSRGNELVKDWRFSGSGRGGGDSGRERDRHVDARDTERVERRDYRRGAPSSSWQPVHHVVTDHRSRSSLVNQRPYGPPIEKRRDDVDRPPRRTVLLPATNPFNTAASATQPTTATENETATAAAGGVRVGHHTIVKRKRAETTDSDGHAAPRTSPPASHSGAAAATLLLSNAPRFILNFKLLMEHFGQFGSILGIEIQEAASTATVKYGTAEEVLRALTGPPLHPQARLSVLPAQQPQQPGFLPAVGQQQNGEHEDEAEEEEADAHHNGTSQLSLLQPQATAPPATLSVGKHTITLKPKTVPSPPPPQPLPAVQPAVPTEPPAVGSALHTAQLIRQQKQSQQQQQPSQPNHTTSTSHPQPSAPSASPTSHTTPTPPAPQPPTSAPAPPNIPTPTLTKEHRTALTKLNLLQAQIDQQERLMQRLDVAMGGQVAGSMEYQSLYAQRLNVDLEVEETRRQWREARGKVVMMAIKSGNGSIAAAPPTASSAAEQGNGSEPTNAMAM